MNQQKNIKFHSPKHQKFFKTLVLGQEGNYSISFNPFLFFQGVVLFVAFLVVSISIGNSLIGKPQVNQALVINEFTLKQTQPAIVNLPVSYSILVKQNSIRQGQSLIKLQKGAKNIKIKTINTQEANQILSQQQSSDQNGLTLKQRQQLSSAILKNKSVFAKAGSFLLASIGDSMSSITSTIAELTNQHIIKTKDADFVDISGQQNKSQNQTGEYVKIDYQASAPVMTETDINKGKSVTVFATDQQQEQSPLTDVLAYSNIPEIFKVGQEDKIKIKWQNNNNQDMQFKAYDLNNNGYIDYVEWTVPHLSRQTFNIIYISKAFKLDQSKNIIEDIYNKVKSKDNIYANLTDGQYARVTFEKALTNKNDITLYAKSKTGAKIEVYTENGSQLIATFNNISQDGKYRILLTNLQTPTDVFDLKITSLSLGQSANADIDYIVDPSSGPNFPSTAIDDSSVGSVVWANPGNVTASDNVYATASLGAAGVSHYIKATNFGFNIPAGATINGILVEWEVSASNSTDVKDFFATIVKGGVIGSTNRANPSTWTTTDAFLSHGNSSDLWGETWTANDINAVNFGATLSAQDATTAATAKVDSVRITVTYTAASNTAPSITAGPSDGGSSATTPTNVSSNVAFTGTATDTESDNYYLAICKTNSITAVNSAAPTCGGGNWCISSSTASGSQASCNYTTLAADAESNVWFAFVCDNNSSSLCSVSAQGSGVNGSPFAVNHAPSFTVISNTAGSIFPDSNVSFTTTASDSDASSTVTLYVCKASDFTGTACGAGGAWCSSSASSTNPTCNYTVLSSDSKGLNTYYGNIIDNLSLASTSNPLSSTFTVGGTKSIGGPPPPPIVTGIKVNKTTIGGNGSFDFTTTGSGYNKFTITTNNGLGSNTQLNLVPGTYFATEIVPSGWVKTKDTCGNITVVAGQITTCSVENTIYSLAPIITSISLAEKLAGDAGFTLTVNGANFISASVVRFNASDRKTAYISPIQLTAEVLASDLATAGTFDITVFNPGSVLSVAPVPPPPITCSTNLDCGTNKSTGSPFCQSGNIYNVYQNYITYICNNPGTTSSTCTNSTAAQLQKTCTAVQFCFNGSCVLNPNIQAPTILSRQPTSGSVGTSVTIRGNSFTPTGNKIKFGNLGSENNPKYSLNSLDGKTLVFTVPSSNYPACWSFKPACGDLATSTQPGTYVVSVINSNGTSNAVTFKVLTP